MKLKFDLSLYFFLFQIFIACSASALPETHLLEDSEKLLIKLESPAKLPAQIKLSKTDASVLFVNATKDTPITLEVEFGEKDAHCATANLKWSAEEKKIKSSEPIAPKNFAALCFPNKGTYNVNIYGLSKNGSVSKTQVIAP